MGRHGRAAALAAPLLLLLASGCRADGAEGAPVRESGRFARAAPVRGSGRVAEAGPPPARADSSFAALVARLSEPGGYFDTDNLISNEASYLHALGPLRERGVRGGAYIGVGPDQNFSYIAQIRPRVAFIIDIRRGNLLELLWYKALFELARDRADYLALLFGRPRPDFAAPDGAAGLARLLDYFDATPADPERMAATRAAVHAALARYGVPLSDDDVAMIDRIASAFVEAGPSLRFTSYGRAPRSYYPTYRQLLLEHDLSGRGGSYLAREEDFRFVKRLQTADRIVPVVGDLAGPHALRAIGRAIDGMGLRVSAFYVSNVEFYLMGDGTFDRFAANVLTLPLDSGAVLIRSYFHPFRRPTPGAVPGYASSQIVQAAARFVARAEAGGYAGYRALLADTVGG